MYCPRCKAEYRPGYSECADCGVPLVYELPQDRPFSAGDEEAGSLVPVFSTFSQEEVILIQSLLDAEGIVYNFQGELFRGSGVFITPVILYVARNDAARVREILGNHGVEPGSP